MCKESQNYPAIVAGIWIDPISAPPFKEGWYLVVAEGHGKRRMAVDYYNIDNVQWQEEHKDNAVSITHYRKLPEMPGEKSRESSAYSLMFYAKENAYFGSNSQSQIIEIETLEGFFDSDK